MARKLSQEEHAEVFRMLIHRARTDFLAYLLCMHPPGISDFVMSKMHAYIAKLFQEVTFGKRKQRQLISVPPQHGKSSVLTKEGLSWYIGVNPGRRIAITGFSHDLCTDFARAIRARIENTTYNLIFPQVKINPAMDRQDHWETTNGTTIIASSVGKKLTGQRVDVLVIDDPHSGRREAESPTYRRTVKNWFFGDCVTRLAPNSLVMAISTRWHPQDLIGHLTSEDYVEELMAAGQPQEVFEVTNLECICTKPETDPLGRKEGECLFPEVRTQQFVEAIRARIPAYEWESQYQGRPKAQGSDQCDISRIVRISENDFKQQEGLIFCRGFDLAATEGQVSDYSAGALLTYQKSTGFVFLVDMFRRKLAWPKLRKEIYSIALTDKAKTGCAKISMEGVAGFTTCVDEIRADLMGIVRVTKKNPGKQDKLQRAMSWLNLIEAGKFHIVYGGWNKDFLYELELFPSGDHDDQIDAVSVGLEELITPAKILLA